MSSEGLHALAARAGIAIQWTDLFGREQQVQDDTLISMLAALHLPAGNDRQCEEGLALLRAEARGSRWPPLVTGTVGQAVALPGLLPNGARYRLQLEGGTVTQGRLLPAEDSKPAGSAESGARLPAQQTPGYHTLEAGGQRCLLAIAPRRCFSIADAASSRGPESSGLPWGVAALVYRLRRTGDGGLADFSSIESLAQAAARQGASALALSPLHAMFSASPERSSSYGPSSRFFFNVLHIDPARLLGEASLREAINELPGCASALEQLEAGELVDWQQAATWRLRLLRALFDRWRQVPATEHEAFAQFCDRGGPDLLDHARYEALHAWLLQEQATGVGNDWRQWPQALRDPRGQAVQVFAQQHSGTVNFHRFLQWQANRARERAQHEAHNAGMALGLITDLPAGADPGGSEAWSLQPAMLRGLSVGAPPNRLAPEGQDWGVGALSPRALRDQGFATWLVMLRANMAHSGGIRIDHVRGLHRLWLVPEGALPSAGAYLHFPLQDLLRLTALESLRYRCVVIGEEIGTVPPDFAQQLAEAGVLGSGLAYGGGTPAPLVLAPLEDMLGIVGQPSLPGYVENQPNLCRRLPQEASTLLEGPEARQRLTAARLEAATADMLDGGVAV